MTLTQRRLTSRFAAGLITLLAIGCLSACAKDEQTAQGGASGSAGTSSEQSTSGDDFNETDDDSSAAQNASPTGCLVGTWLADNKQLGSLFKNAAAGTDAAGAVSDPTGKVLLTFGAQGEYGVEYQNWTMALSQDGMTIELVREGTDSGSYKATDDGSVEWTENSMNSVVTMKTPGGSHQVTGEATSTSGTFACEQDTLEITAEGSTMALDRQ